MFMPWELPELLDGELVRAGWKELQTLLRLGETVRGIGRSNLKVTALETAWYMRNQLLRDTDWAGMAHSLEIRVPLVDIELLRAVVPLLATRHSPGKRDMALTPAKPLPDQVLHRRKTGFSIPVRDWLMQDIAEAGADRRLRGWAKWVYNAGWRRSN
jgi:asparagine synthase (glutamine-hydrolysing)